MRITFEGVQLEGFKSFIEPARFQINAGVGLHFLEGRNRAQPLGSNGAGKTTLWDAVTWCLYARTVSGLRNVDVKPWRSKASTHVKLRLTVDSVLHEITRTLGAKALLSIDGNEAGPDDVVKLIGMPFELFTNTVLLGQGQPLFYDKTAADKMSLFSDVLGLARWDVRAEHASNRAKESDARAIAFARDVENAKARYDQAKADVVAAREKMETAQLDIDKRLARFMRTIKALKTQLDEAMARRDKADLAYDGSAAEHKALERERKELQDLRFFTLGEENEYKLKIQAAKQAVTTITKQIEKLKASGTCPTCGQKIRGSTVEHKNELAAQLAKHERTISRGVPNAVQSALADLDKQIKTNWRHNVEFDRKKEESEAALNYANKQVAECKQQMAIAEALHAEVEKGSDLFAEALHKARKERVNAKDMIVQAEADYAKAMRMATRYAYWGKAFKQVKLFEIEELLAELSLVTLVLLPEFGLDGWAVVYDIERETKAGTIARGLNVMVQSPTSDRLVKWESWSGGEGQRLRLIGALALSETLLNHAGVECMNEMLDEPTQHMSGEGVADMIEHLANRAKRRGTAVWLTDHMTTPSARFATTARVVKAKAGSRIRQGVGPP